MVEARNKADGLVHAVEKTLKELGDKATDDERAKVEAAIEDVKAALKSDDLDEIEAKTTALTEASAEIAQKLYAEQGQPGADGAADSGEASGSSSSDDDVVDAEFEEVDGKDKKSG